MLIRYGIINRPTHQTALDCLTFQNPQRVLSTFGHRIDCALVVRLVARRHLLGFEVGLL
jgi:hypothetical protein